MTFSRPGCLRSLAVCLFCSLPLFSQVEQTPVQQQPPAAPQPSPQQTPQQNPPQQKKANPFETIPQSGAQPQTPPAKPDAPKLETPPVEQVKPAAPMEDVIESI